MVTQPDKPVGRSAAPVAPPVKLLAQAHALPVLQPVTLRRPAAAAALRRLKPDLGIVAAYGKILPPDVLAVPPHGHLNVHASLLPRWRGAWPIGAAILAGADPGHIVSTWQPALKAFRKRAKPFLLYK